MVRCRRILLLTIVLAVSLWLPAQGKAGPMVDPLLGHPVCPKPSYSPLHYWTPAIYCIYCLRHDPVPSLDQYPRGPNAEITPSYRIIKYPCPAADPVDVPYGPGVTGAMPVETPPATP